MAVNFLNEIDSEYDDGSGEVGFTQFVLQEKVKETSTHSINETLLEIFSENREKIANLAAVFNIIFLVICAIGIFANMTSILVFSRKTLRKTAFNNILIAVCIADTFALSGYFLEQLDFAVKVIMNEWTCKAAAFVSNSGTMLSSWIVVLMAIERLYHSKQSCDDSNFFHRANIWKCFFMLCIIYFATHLHVFWTITADTVVQMTCVYETVKYYNFWWGWWIVDACMVSLLPFIVLKIVIAKLILCPSKSEGKDAFSTDKDTNNEMALFIFTKFIICVTTAYVFQLYQRLVAGNYELLYGIKLMYTEDETLYASKLSTYICYTFLLINHSVKLLLFIILNKDFQRQLKQCITLKSNNDMSKDENDFVYLNIAVDKQRKASASTVSSKLSSLLSKYEGQDIEASASVQTSDNGSIKSQNTLLDIQIEDFIKKDESVLCYENPTDIIEDEVIIYTSADAIVDDTKDMPRSNTLIKEGNKEDRVHYGKIHHGMNNTNGNYNNNVDIQNNTSEEISSPFDIVVDLRDNIKMDVLSNRDADGTANENSLLEEVTKQLFPILSSVNLNLGKRTENNSCC